MHLIVPFAGTVSEAGRFALQSLSLPHLDKLLARLSPGPALGSDEFSPNTPHEQALAHAWGWAGTDDADGASSGLADRALPFAARQAAALGLADAGTAWGLLTPVHLLVGSEGINLTDPRDLQLDANASRELLEIVRPLFESEGFALHWAAPLHWLASHPQFDALPAASIDRVIGRNLLPWLPAQRDARLIRRLQNEVQMTLYTHAVNDRREAAGLPTVNSFWLSGCGRLPADAAPAETDIVVDDRLRAPALGEDWAAWCEAWRDLDAGPVASLLASGPTARITLCGERLAMAFTLQPRGLWQSLSARWRRPALPGLLERL
jgi:hypothetical protein